MRLMDIKLKYIKKIKVRVKSYNCVGYHSALINN